ncbi:unnamed protein product [Dovyalis caffra]|uniref:Uncharacterized protein n=1 Tax=Dovyalis caffra TaxID=77055 RepID=A0AAV1RFS5_9ROSI|nr:unnamed protein product [Dovyalis caffra]
MKLFSVFSTFRNNGIRARTCGQEGGWRFENESAARKAQVLLECTGRHHWIPRFLTRGVEKDREISVEYNNEKEALEIKAKSMSSQDGWGICGILVGVVGLFYWTVGSLGKTEPFERICVGYHISSVQALDTTPFL